MLFCLENETVKKMNNKISSKPFDYSLDTCHTSVKETGKMEDKGTGYNPCLSFEINSTTCRYRRVSVCVVFGAS
jgi:hypothetical protein